MYDIKKLLITALSLMWVNSSFAVTISKGVSVDEVLNFEDYSEGSTPYCAIISEGFDTVRLPINFDILFSKQKPYKVDNKHLEKLKTEIDIAINCKLNVVLDFHKYKNLKQFPEKHLERFTRIWEFLFNAFKNKHHSNLIFEIFNEPNLNLTPVKWNELLARVLPRLERIDHKRTLIIGPAMQNSIEGLPELVIPSIENKIIVAFHYYTPMEFTHQLANWSKKYKSYKKRDWPLNSDEILKLKTDFLDAKSWAETHGYQLILGEFGVYKKAPRQSRLDWLSQTTSVAAELNIPWIYWDLSSGFYLYDRKKEQFDMGILKALKLNDRSK
jgi:endoglucanase